MRRRNIVKKLEMYKYVQNVVRKRERNCEKKRERTNERKRKGVRDAKAIAQRESGMWRACNDAMSNMVLARWARSAARS